MKFYYYAILSITYLWGTVVAHRDASMRSMQSEPPEAGEFSVVILGQDNNAPGNFCNVNGGKGNFAGADNNYAVSGGGSENFAGSTFSTISGGTENVIKSFAQKHCTISGGNNNVIGSVFFSSVITGGQTNRMDFGPEIDSIPGGTISGGENNNCSTEYCVATGGASNAAKNVAAVAFGGLGNFVFGQSATSVGGELNSINGAFSIGLGVKTIVDNDSSMVINLVDSRDDVFDPKSDTDGDGQFIVDAKSYTFQIGKNRDDLRFQITEDNIQNLIDALENAA